MPCCPTTYSRATIATMAPTGSIKTPSLMSSSRTERSSVRRARSGVTTVGPVTIISAPKSEAVGQGIPSMNRAASIPITIEMMAPAVSSIVRLRCCWRRSCRRSPRPPSNRMMATARLTRSTLAEPNTAGSNSPKTSGPMATPVTSSKTMPGSAKRTATTCAAMPQAIANAAW